MNHFRDDEGPTFFAMGILATSCAILQLSRQGIMKHLDLLANAGLVQVQTKGREKRYVFHPEALQAASTWIETIGKQWDERLQRLKDLVEDE